MSTLKNIFYPSNKGTNMRKFIASIFIVISTLFICVAPASAVAAPTTANFERLQKCEAPAWAGGWSANTGNGYYGGLQFSLGSWRAVGGKGYPNKNSKATQIAKAKKLYAKQGWKAWPVCSKKLHFR